MDHEDLKKYLSQEFDLDNRIDNYIKRSIPLSVRLQMSPERISIVEMAFESGAREMLLEFDLIMKLGQVDPSGATERIRRVSKPFDILRKDRKRIKKSN